MATREQIGAALKAASAAADAGDPAAADEARRLAQMYRNATAAPVASAAKGEPDIVPRGGTAPPATVPGAAAMLQAAGMNTGLQRNPDAVPPAAAAAPVASAATAAAPPQLPAAPDPTEGMSGWEKLGAGYVGDLVGIGKGAQVLGAKGLANLPGVNKLLPYLGVNPDEMVTKAEASKAEHEKMMAPVGETWQGKVGALGGDIAEGAALTAATGGLGAPAAIARIGSKAPIVGRYLGGKAAQAIGTDAIAGGAQSALEGGDVGADTATAAGMSAVLPVGGRIIGKAKKVANELGLSSVGRSIMEGVSAIPFVGVGPGRMLQSVDRRRQAALDAFREATRTHEREVVAPLRRQQTEVARDARQAAKEQTAEVNRVAQDAYKAQVKAINAEAQGKAGQAIQNITANVTVRPTAESIKQTKNLQSTYAGVLRGYPDLSRALDQLTIPNAKMTGERMAALKSRVGAAARDAKGGDAGALHEIERHVIDTLYANMPEARARALKDAFEVYGKGVNSQFLPPKPQKVRVKPNVPELVVPAGPLPPGAARPFSRTRMQRYGAAALRGAIVPVTDEEE